MSKQKKDRVEIYESKKVRKQYGWRVIAANGKRIAISGELYKNKKHAEAMVKKLFPALCES
jgi:uncharacterized protein YegP (UPF0339 family)